MKEHLIVYFCYFNVEHIKMAFESGQMEGIDYFVVENKSKYSGEIEEYFKNKRLKGYIQFEENIGANAMNIFIRDYWDLLKEYKYITFTDADIYVYNIGELVTELKEGLGHKECLVSSIHLWTKNNPHGREQRIIGIEPYLEFMANNPYGIGTFYGGNGGAHFITLKNENLDLLKNIHFKDSNIDTEVRKRGGNWRNTSRQKGYHLTWDLIGIGEGTEYGLERANPKIDIWNSQNESKYRKIC